MPALVGSGFRRFAVTASGEIPVQLDSFPGVSGASVTRARRCCIVPRPGSPPPRFEITFQMAPPIPESQYRDHAANERTMLAWIRTGIALMAFGFAIARFGLFLRELVQVSQVRTHPVPGLGSGWFGVVLVALGLGVNAAATLRYARVRRALLRGESAAPGPMFVYVLGVGSVLVAAAMAVTLARTLAE